MSQHGRPSDVARTELDGAHGRSFRNGDDGPRLLELLNERLRFETLLARLSATFIHMPAEDVDGQIERGLRQIVEFLDIERSSLGQFSEDGSELLVNDSYTVPGLARLLLVNSAHALARKRSESVLRESEGRFRLMADTAPVMVWMSGPDKLCTYFNRSWLDFTGRPLHREVGAGWSEGVHADDLLRCLDTYDRAFEARQGFRMEYRLRRFDGDYRWVLDTGVPRFEPDGT